MSVCKKAGFLSPNQISKLVWDSEGEEAGASNDSIIYLGNKNLYICKTTGEISVLVTLSLLK